MIKIGKFNTLTISRLDESGLVLDGGDSGPISLETEKPVRGMRAGDELNVFVYSDGRGKLLATTRTPSAEVGEVAWLKVVSTSRVGAFLDWGLKKDLFVPFSEQKPKMVAGRYYLVKLYLDEDNRIVASARLDDFVRDEAVYLKQGQRVGMIVAAETELGYKVVVDHAFWGVLYRNEVFEKLEIGRKLAGYVKKIRSDGKIDLAVERERGSRQADQVSERILAFLRSHQGVMHITDRSDPQLIYDTFGVSKKAFKQALGHLYKQRQVTLAEDSVRLTKQP